jgi:hypothetical protein
MTPHVTSKPCKNACYAPTCRSPLTLFYLPPLSHLRGHDPQLQVESITMDRVGPRNNCVLLIAESYRPWSPSVEAESVPGIRCWTIRSPSSPPPLSLSPSVPPCLFQPLPHEHMLILISPAGRIYHRMEEKPTRPATARATGQPGLKRGAHPLRPR